MDIIADNISSYDSSIARFHKKHAWTELIAYCANLERQITELPAAEKAAENKKKRFLAQIFTEMSIAYSVLGMNDKAVIAAQQSLQALRRGQGGPIAMHHGYLMLAHMLVDAERVKEARKACMRAITCLLSRSESEFLACGLSALSGLEQRHGQAEHASAFEQLAIGLRQERQYAHRSDTDHSGETT